jgi:arginine/lysine/ornithine decarboxylase
MADNQVNLPLFAQLMKLANKPHAPFYAPGHKQGYGMNQILTNSWGENIFKADLPELPDLDNLFAPDSFIKDAQELASQAFGAEKTWFLINGSTSGIIASILAVCNPGDKIILPRNIHQSAIFGLILSGAIPIFINPEYNPYFDLFYCLTPQAIEATLEQHGETKAVLIIYPTYQGICGDLKAIAELTHKYNIPLLVDEAHGAHFNFHPDLPPSALSLGADLSVQSTHKVLGAMTQASMLHIQGQRIDPHRVSKALQLVQSSSPSYLLLASLDAARQQIATQGYALLDHTLQLAKEARTKLSNLNKLSVLELNNSTPSLTRLDTTRLTVNVSQLGLTGYEADQIFDQDLAVTPELPSLTSLTFIISIGNTQADIDSLIKAFAQLQRDQKRDHRFELDIVLFQDSYVASISPRDAFFAIPKTIPIENSIGYLSAETICPYPPGIPILMPGEVITPEALQYLQQVINLGYPVTGNSDRNFKTIQVILRSCSYPKTDL